MAPRINSLKIQNARTAVGYWGRDPRARVVLEQTPQRIRAMLQDQLRTGGLQARLWLNVHRPTDGETTALPGTLKCSCVKAAGQHAERRCLSCHGNDFIPGYKLFGYETIWVASISPNNVLTGLQVDHTLKPNRLVLASAALTGTMVTPDLFFARQPATGGSWESRSDFYTTDAANQSVVTEFSTNKGLTWHLLSTIGSVNPVSGPIRFRVTISRTSLTIKSPAWEILRARFPVFPVLGRMGPWLLLLKNVTPDTANQDTRGIQIDSSVRYWTAPLSFYDCSVGEQPSFEAAVDRNDIITDPAFIQFLEGTRGLLQQRSPITNVSYTDPLGYFTRQFFDARLAQPEEFTSLVFLGVTISTF